MGKLMKVFVAEPNNYKVVFSNNLLFIPADDKMPNLKQRRCFYLYYHQRLFHFHKAEIDVYGGKPVLNFELGNSFAYKEPIEVNGPYRYIPLPHFGMIEIRPGLLINIPKGYSV
jgi:hypothetical protein